MNPSRPVLSFQELEAFDVQAPAGVRRRFCCPLCGAAKPRDSAHRCLSVDVASGLWRCFRCEAKGQLREKWQDKPLERIGRSSQALRRAFALDAAEQGRVEVPKAPALGPSQPLGAELVAGKEAQEQTTENSLRRALQGLSPLPGTRGETYLGGRGVPLEVCLNAKVKFAPSWMGRPAVVFPIYDGQGQLVAAQGRYTDGRDDPKTRTMGPKKEGVFLSGNFWDLVTRGAPVVITEAPIDALSLAACGFPALALCGKSGWPSWLPIKCAFKEIAVAFDADEAGEEGAAKLTPTLESLGAKVRRVVPEDAKDWNQMLAQMGKDRLGDWLCIHLL